MAGEDHEKYWYICFFDNLTYASYTFDEVTGKVESLSTSTTTTNLLDTLPRTAEQWMAWYNKPPIHIDPSTFWRNLQ
jgi:hypothetical protein